MKYLKKFESKLKTIQYKDMTNWGSTEPQKVKKQIEPEYFNLVFADFIDEGSTVDFDMGDDPSFPKEWNPFWEIFIDEPKIGYSNNIDDYIKSIDKVKERNLDIKSCIDKIKDDHPHINVDFHIKKSGESNDWVDNTKRIIHLTFSYK
jgi:hypothetical protein